jgi:hypothetical protein
MHRIIGEISSATFLLALFTGLLYISGDSYIYGYLEQLSLTPRMFVPSFNEILSHGFYMLFIGGIYLIIPTFLIVFLFYCYSYMIGEISEIGFIRKIFNFIFFIPQKKESEYKKPKLISKITNLALTTLVFTSFIAVLLFTIYKVTNFSFSQGKEQGEKYLKMLILSSESNKIFIGSNPIQGSIVRCSSTHCAVYIKEKNVIKTVPVSNIKSISVKHPKHKQINQDK